MSEHDPADAPDGTAGEAFLGRWSRLKARAREREAQAQADTELPRHEDQPAPPADEAAAAASAPPVPLPDVEQLDQDSDYSAFLAPDVDAALRQRALRKLFHSPKFNVFDGLDTYRDDFTSFPALGSILTADMRHHLERAARELAARAEDAVDAVTRQAPPQDAAPPAVTHEPAAAAGPPTARNEDDAEHGPA